MLTLANLQLQCSIRKSNLGVLWYESRMMNPNRNIPHVVSLGQRLNCCSSVWAQFKHGSAQRPAGGGWNLDKRRRSALAVPALVMNHICQPPWKEKTLQHLIPKWTKNPENFECSVVSRSPKDEDLIHWTVSIMKVISMKIIADRLLLML